MHYIQGNDTYCGVYCAKTVVHYFKGETEASHVSVKQLTLATNNIEQSVLSQDSSTSAALSVFQDQKGDSFFSIYAIESALGDKNIVMQYINTSKCISTSEKTPPNIFGCFVVNVGGTHWKAIVKGRDELWYNMDSLRSEPSMIERFNGHPLCYFCNNIKPSDSIFACFLSENMSMDILNFASNIGHAKNMLIRNSKSSFHKLDSADIPKSVLRFMLGVDKDGVTKLSMSSHEESDYVFFSRCENGDFFVYPYDFATFTESEVIDIYTYIFSSFDGKSTSPFISIRHAPKIDKSEIMKNRFASILYDQ